MQRVEQVNGVLFTDSYSTQRFRVNLLTYGGAEIVVGAIMILFSPVNVTIGQRQVGLVLP